jgi:DnaK suppressor protein
MDSKKLDRFKQRLLEMRSQIINRNKSRRDALIIATEDLADETDHAAAVVQQGVALNVQERERFVLGEIENALSKFEDGTYGLCEDTEEPIDEGRLEAEPYTRYSVEAAEAREKRSKRFAVGS